LRVTRDGRAVRERSCASVQSRLDEMSREESHTILSASSRSSPSRLEMRFPDSPKWRRLKFGSVGHLRMRLQCALRLITPAGRFSTLESACPLTESSSRFGTSSAKFASNAVRV